MSSARSPFNIRSSSHRNPRNHARDSNEWTLSGAAIPFRCVRDFQQVVDRDLSSEYGEFAANHESNKRNAIAP